MTESVTAAPPFVPAQKVGRHLAELLRLELRSLTDELVEEIQRCVPDYARPRAGFALRVQRSVATSLDLLVRVLADGEPVSEAELKVFHGLAQGEYLQGRGINALQSAFRIGARTIWRRLSETGQRKGVPPEEMYAFAETLFTCAEVVSTYSVQAYEQLQNENIQGLKYRRQRLLELLVSDPGKTTFAAIRALARQIDWQLPDTIACIALNGSSRGTYHIPPTVQEEALADLDRADPFLLLPEPERPGRLELLSRALGDMRFAVGPSVPLVEAPLSLQMARNALSLASSGMIPDQRRIHCEEHIPELLLFGSDGVMRILARRGFSSLAGLTAGQRVRLPETLLAWLTTGGSVAETAIRLMVHPQTVRYRMRQLEEIFGDQLHDHDWRFEMQLVLRAELLVKSQTRPAPR
ncbi:MAG: putative transcriptional regulator, PucR family [Streptosporangiaceae bacterium]|jgi:hypothetical protein|nr:putative transcriptional regulator, PucR family [Streptosporangiaceae bacterium]